MAIQLTIVVDTASLPSGAGSSAENPRTFGHDGAFMITDSTHCASNNGSADLQITGASVGDNFQIWGSSLSNQFLDEVFIYDFKHLDGDKVLDVNGLKPQV
ncbi:MAG TPA: AidA/PixA family protein, partial [Thermoanaerobaculia bacterium]|nr:AidA/PixA family protein [Thermoanaerobaculia bacterium]